MKFAQTFIKHHVMTILLYILVVVFGFYSFQNLPLALMPSMEVPAAVVYATYPGAGPEDIEQQVTKKLEGAVAGLSRRPSGLRKTRVSYNSLAHRTTWLRSDLGYPPQP